MMQHNLSCWPLALSFSRGKPSLQELRDYSRAWTAWLDRGERFATLRILLDSPAYGHPPGGAQERKHWFTANGERLQHQVLGMATVAPADVVRKINKIKADHFLGVPSRAFDTVDAALDWVLPQFEAGMADIDANALKARVIAQCSQILADHGKSD